MDTALEILRAAAHFIGAVLLFVAFGFFLRCIRPPGPGDRFGLVQYFYFQMGSYFSLAGFGLLRI